MHSTLVTMKSGQVVSGVIWLWAPKEGYLRLIDEESGVPVHIELRDVATAVTPGVHMSVNKIGYRDELERARKDGWVAPDEPDIGGGI